MDESIRVLHVATQSDVPAVADQTADRFAVDAVTDVSSGLDRLGSTEYDCVVSGYELPEMTGLDFFRRVRETAPATPFVLYADDRQIASDAITAGVTEYVPPGDSASLPARIEAAVSGTDRQIADRLRRLEALVQTVPTAIVRVDTTGEIAFANDSARSILGFEDDQPLARTYDDPDWEIRDLDGEPIPDEELPFQRVLASGEPVDGYRHSIRCPDGVRRIVEVSGAPLSDGQGAIEGVVFAISDATPRRQRETAFEALHEIATTIQREQTVEAVCERTVTAAADILEFDTCSIIIREGEWLVPYAVSENTPPDGVQRMRIDEGLAGKTFQSGESEIVDRVPDNDDVKPAKESYRSGISVAIGKYGVFQAVSTTPGAFSDEDIEFAELLLSHTENKIEQLERETELRRQNERLDEFAGIVSHDLSNPLNVAQLQLELARESVDNERLAAVARAHDRMETLIEALLTLARSRNPVTESVPVDLAAVAAQSLATLDTDAVRLSTESDAYIQADRDLVTILLENLLKNSAEHGCDGTEQAEDTVTVRIGLLDDGFFFEDDGAGVPAEIREEIFDVGVSTGPDGTGIGLKIVTEIVDAHGWAIDVAESDDGGARFEITGVSIDG